MRIKRDGTPGPAGLGKPVTKATACEIQGSKLTVFWQCQSSVPNPLYFLFVILNQKEETCSVRSL